MDLKLTYVGLFVLFGLLSFAEGKPNIIIIVADDLGWNDLSFHGSPQIPTPNLDKLAKEGVILNNYYVCPVCSPSRGALMTGLYPIHTGLQRGAIPSTRPYGLPLKHILMPQRFKKLNYVTHAVGKVSLQHDVILYNEPWGLPLNETLLPQHLQTLGYASHAVGKHDVIFVDQPWGLPLYKTLISQHFKGLGYSTHAVGKWHLGFFRKEYTPTFRGFDSHFGYWSGKEDYFDHSQQMGEYWGLDFHHNMQPVTDCLGNYSTSLFADHAVSIIKSHNTSQPLFLYVAYQSVHSANSYSPLQAPQEYIKRFSYIEDEKRRTFAAMVSAMDDSVKEIVDNLKAKGMFNDSIIVFTTDNGGPAAGFNDNAASNWPLRGVKATLWEGGVRGISFVWSPLLKNKGRTSMDLMHITDWLPTLYSAAGGNVSSLGKLDGYNVWETLSSKDPSPRKEVLLNIDPVNKVAALRVGNFKVIQGTVYGGSWDGWYGPSGRESDSSLSPQYKSSTPDSELLCKRVPPNASSTCTPNHKPCLFDVENDPCELYNLAEEKPQILASLLQRLTEYNATAIPIGNKPADPMSNPKYYDYQWVNWMDYNEESNFI